MAKDRGIGIALLLGSIAGILAYGWLLWSFSTLILQLTAFVAVASLLGILGWIGWTIATTPSPSPLETETPAAPSTQSTSDTTKQEGS